MVKASGLYGGVYLTAADLTPGRRSKATIFSVDTEAIGQDQKEKLVISLTSPQGRAWPKPIVVNKTNMLALSAAFGDETDEWIGRAVEVWSEPTMFAGKRVQGIRIDVAPAADKPAASARARPTGDGVFDAPGNGDGDDLNDDIPF